MSRHHLRLFIVALVTITAIGPVAANATTNEFRLVCFPHEDVTSAFGNDWGDARSGGRHHEGTDIFGEKHSPVHAVADGFVTAMEDGALSGFYVRISHQDGWESWYMHLNNDSPGTDDGAAGAAGAFAPDLEVG